MIVGFIIKATNFGEPVHIKFFTDYHILNSFYPFSKVWNWLMSIQSRVEMEGCLIISTYNPTTLVKTKTYTKWIDPMVPRVSWWPVALSWPPPMVHQIWEFPILEKIIFFIFRSPKNHVFFILRGPKKFWATQTYFWPQKTWF